jgi:hypothetical protein
MNVEIYKEGDLFPKNLHQSACAVMQAVSSYTL